MGGVPGLATALVVLAAVPAAFQYGLWDSNTQDRCRRLELLLMTELGARDYWSAAAAAAWKRGRGYFFVALVLWLAGAIAGKITLALRDFEPAPWPVSLVYMGKGLLPLKVRAFLDYAAPRLKSRLSRLFRAKRRPRESDE